MEFDFETLVERSGANLKLMMTPPEVVKAGNISLDGAEPDFKSAPVIEERLFPNLEKKNRHNRKIRIYTQKKQYKQNKPLKVKNMTFNHYFNNIG